MNRKIIFEAKLPPEIGYREATMLAGASVLVDGRKVGVVCGLAEGHNGSVFASMSVDSFVTDALCCNYPAVSMDAHTLDFSSENAPHRLTRLK